MKNVIKILGIVSVVIIVACKKEKSTMGTPANLNNSSLSEFYKKHEVKAQIFSINAVSGGSFTSIKGTVVSIPANAFVNSSGATVSGVVTIEFKDIYKKSDMLLSNIPSMLNDGRPLKSAGEFFIKTTSNNAPVSLATGKKITIKQPIENSDGVLDVAMTPFVQPVDSDFTGGWQPTIEDSITWSTSSYIYHWYQTSTYNEGVWLNTDNSSYFSAYQQTTLNLIATNQVDYSEIDVFLVFENVNSCVRLYPYWPTNNFVYNYAPIGLQCTMVAISAKDGKLHAAFKPITISANQSVNFTLSEMSTTTFMNQLDALN